MCVIGNVFAVLIVLRDFLVRANEDLWSLKGEFKYKVRTQ